MRDEVAALMAKAEAIDAKEAERVGADVAGTCESVSEETLASRKLRAQRTAEALVKGDAACAAGAGAEEAEVLAKALAARRRALTKVKAALKDLEAEPSARDGANGHGAEGQGRPLGELKPKPCGNLTDPHSRLMKTKAEGFLQGYNAQVVVDAETQLIVATDLVQARCDQGQLPRMAAKVEPTCGKKPEAIIADAGYRNEADLRTMERRGMAAFVALGKGKRPINPDTLPATARMAAKLRTPEGKEKRKLRSWVVEAPFGWIKHNMGFRRFSCRGKAGVRSEWFLVCSALNITRMIALPML